METKEAKLIKNTLLFSIGNAGAKLMMLVIVPLYTYYVTTEQMGIYDMAQTCMNLFMPVSCLALYEGIYRWLLDEHAAQGQILKNGLLLSCGLIIIFDIISWFMLQFIQYEFIVEFLLILDSSALYHLTQFATRGLRNNRIYAVQGIVYAVVLVLGNLLFVIKMQMQARGLMLSLAVANLATVAFLVFQQKDAFLRCRKESLNLELMKKLSRFSVPMVPNTTAWWLVSSVNRLIINLQLGASANGIYAISLKFPSVVNMLSTFFYQAWQEQAISEYGSKDRDSYYSKIFNQYARVLLSAVVVLMPLSKFVVLRFMDPSYADAHRYIGILYLSSVFSAFGAFYGTGYLSAKKTSGAFKTTVVGALINTGLSLMMIGPFGLYAAALSNLLGNLAIWLTRIYQTRQYFSIKLDICQMVCLLVANIATVFLVNRSGMAGLICLEIAAMVQFLIYNQKLLYSLIKTIFKKVCC